MGGNIQDDSGFSYHGLESGRAARAETREEVNACGAIQLYASSSTFLAAMMCAWFGNVGWPANAFQVTFLPFRQLAVVFFVSHLPSPPSLKSRGLAERADTSQVPASSHIFQLLPTGFAEA